MTREQRIARARELREQGLSYQRIADELGVSSVSVQRWLKPEWARERARKDNVRRAAAKRAWENGHDRPRCPRCGTPMCVGALRKGYEVCARCYRVDQIRERDGRREQIAAMWNAGKSLREIAAAQGSTAGSINVTLVRMRAAGWDVPQRYAANRQKAAA